MIYNEKYNTEKIIELLNIPKPVLKDFLYTSEKDKDNKKWNPDYLMRDLKNLLHLGDSQDVEYDRKENSRIYTKSPSAQRFPTHIRNLIVDASYRDYDIKNCHYEILRNLCGIHQIGVPTRYLDEYCGNRENVLKDNHITKMTMLCILNQDNPKKVSNRFLENFITELKRIKDALFEKLYDDTIELKKKNPRSSYLNKYHFTRIEDEMLHRVINYYWPDGTAELVPMYDGLMTPKPLDLDKLKELTGLVWVEKCRLPTREIPDIKDLDPSSSTDQIDYGKLYYNHYGDDWIVNKEMGSIKLYHFNSHNKLWYEVDKPYSELHSHIKEELLPIICNPKFIQDNGTKNLDDITKKIKDLITSASCAKNIGEQFINYLIYLWRENIEMDSIPHIIHFKNKSYDFKKMDWCERVREHYATLTGPELLDYNEEDYQYLKERVEEILSVKEDRDTYLYVLATACMGKTLEKVTFANGSGGNGKGVLNGCIMKYMLGDYYYTGDNNILMCKQSGANQSIASMKGKRMVVMEEPDENKPINFCMVKMITGGDAVNARALYDKNCITQLVLTLIVECNKKPSINGDTGDSMFRRLLDILFPNSFKDKDAPDRYDNDGHKDSDPLVKEKCKPIATIFFYYIINWMNEERNKLNYDNIWNIKVSNDIKKRSKEYIESNNPVKEMIEQVVQKITKIEDKSKAPLIKFNEIYDKIKLTDYWFNQTTAFKRKHGKNNLIKKLEKDPQMSRFIERDNHNLVSLKDYEWIPDENLDNKQDETPECVKPPKKPTGECEINSDNDSSDDECGGEIVSSSDDDSD